MDIEINSKIMPEEMGPEEHEVFSLDHDKLQKDLVRLQSGAIDDINERKQIAREIMAAVKKGFYDWPEVGMTEEEITKLLAE